jgi:hypothetical protein
LHWILYFLDSVTSSLPFKEGACSLSHTALVVPHTWLLVLELNLVHILYQLSIGKCPYLGNTLLSLFSYVHGDISTKYILGIPQGWSLGRGLVFFFWVWTGRTIPLPAIRVHTSKGFHLYVRVVDRLRSADCQVAP